MELLEAIKTRRSIRRYKNTPISDEEINKVLDAAHWAPSWANAQCWRFIVVTDKSVRYKLSETLTAGNSAIPSIKQAPITIIACAELGKSGFKNDELISIKDEWWYMFDVALATQNLTLAAHSLGLGTVHIGGFDSQKAAQILKLPQEIVVVEMIPIGHPEGAAKATSRKELSEIVSWI